MTYRMFTKVSALAIGSLSLFLSCLVPGTIHAQETQPAREVANEKGLAITDASTLVFASVETGRAAVSVEDGFVRRMQPLERKIRLRSDEPVSKEEYLEFLRSGVQEWREHDRDVLASAVEQLRPKLRPFDLPFPAEIQLVRVGSKVEANAPHCRGPAIVLPDSFFANPQRAASVLAHELFHVLSSHNQELRDEMYQTISFNRCNEIELPERLLPRRLTNPDAPSHEHVLELDKLETPVFVVPVTMTRTYDYTGGGLFDYIDFKLLQVEEVEGKWQPKLSESGGSQLLSPRDMPSFMEKIGRNTNYIIHPEETLADNFIFLVMEREQLPDPWVVDALRKVLLRKEK